MSNNESWVEVFAHPEDYLVGVFVIAFIIIILIAIVFRKFRKR